MFSLICIFLLFVASVLCIAKASGDLAKYFKWGGISGLCLSVIWLILVCILTVPAGHVKVATLFGKVQDSTYSEGLHFVNPLLDFTPFDLRK